jgi:glycosyltransferase involved in cell wall biosynthesis
MRILHTSEAYPPSVGGSQEVVRQISERLAARGHEVTVATSRMDERSSSDMKGVSVEEFDIGGSLTFGLHGEVDRYQQFLLSGRFDVMMNYGPQTWSTDIAFQVLPQLSCARVFAPCGLSGLRRRIFDSYFAQLPPILRNYDQFIFHSDVYQDIAYVRQHVAQDRISVIPNGCSEGEFARASGAAFRQRYGIADDVPLLLSVGNHTGLKGHDVVLEAFRRTRIGKAVLVIAGKGLTERAPVVPTPRGLVDRLRAARSRLQEAIRPSQEGVCYERCSRAAKAISVRSVGRKRVLLLDASREELVDAYAAADLFLFASRVECSPVVLFEAMASRTPFITTDCGNSREIIDWSGSGVLTQTAFDQAGWGDGDPDDLAHKIAALMADKPRRAAMAEAGYAAWRDRFTWEKLALEYEAVYRSAVDARVNARSTA